MSNFIADFAGKIDLLIVFAGMALLQWRVVNALDSLAQLLAKFQPGFIPPLAPPAAPSPPQIPTIVHVPAQTPLPVVDQALVNFIRKQEGYSAKPYWDYKQWTVGYGTRASGPNDVVTPTEAETRLINEIAIAEKHVEMFAPNAPCGVKQALTDLTFNAGEGWEQAELGTLVRAGKYEDAKSHLLQYDRAGGQVNTTLAARRKAEVEWFDHPL